MVLPSIATLARTKSPEEIHRLTGFPLSQIREIIAINEVGIVSTAILPSDRMDNKPDAPNYRAAADPGNCANCLSWRDRQDSEKTCDRYDFAAEPSGTCDNWQRRSRKKFKPQKGGALELIEDDVDRADAQAPDLPEMIADRGLELSDNATQGWLAQVKQWLAQQSTNGADLQVMRDRLPEVYEQMDSEPFADALLQMSLLANLSGREEVEREID